MEGVPNDGRIVPSAEQSGCNSQDEPTSFVHPLRLHQRPLVRLHLPTADVRFPPIADIRTAADNCLVSRGSILDELSKRAPTIVAFTLFAALVADWIDAPVVLPQGLAIIVGSLALVLLAARGRRQFNAKKTLGFDSDIGWIAYELAGKGTPQGFYILGFFGVLTIVLTGVQSPYSLPAWAAFVLHIAWGMANARYPLDDE